MPESAQRPNREQGKEQDVLIVGAGMAGLTAARALRRAGDSVTLLEAGSEPGGRMATERLGPGLADVGAQYFVARTPPFQAQVTRWIQAGLVYLWAMGFSTGSLKGNVAQGQARYAVKGGMVSLARHLARGLDLHLGHAVERIVFHGPGWEAQVGSWAFQGRGLLLALPAPLSLGLLQEGGVALAPQEREVLAAIQYSPSLTALFWVEGEVHIPPPGAVQRPIDAIPWIGDNQQKGISPQARILTVQASGEYSRRMWEMPEREILESLAARLEPYLGPDARIREARLKRWPLGTVSAGAQGSQAYFVAESLPGLFFAGDAFSIPRLEGAFLSGTASGEALASWLEEQGT